MNLLLIITCYKCGRLLIAKTGQKTRSCPYCGFELQVKKAKVVAHADSSNDASMVLRKLKEKTRTTG